MPNAEIATGRVKIYFHLTQDEDGYPPVATESLWAQSIGSGRYLIDNIPFFEREANLGDTVEADVIDGQLWFKQVVGESSNSLVRIILFEPGILEEVRRNVVLLGCTAEWSGGQLNVLGVSVPLGALGKLQEYLAREFALLHLDYEEALLRE